MRKKKQEKKAGKDESQLTFRLDGEDAVHITISVDLAKFPGLNARRIADMMIENKSFFNEITASLQYAAADEESIN